MTVFEEGNLQVTFNGVVGARKFDDDSHGLNHCMRAVDFIVELTDRYFYVEFKDPQHPQAPPGAAEEYRARLMSEQIDEEFKYKFRDSFLFELGLSRADKPIHYLVMIALDTLTGADLIRRQEALERKLPLRGPGEQPWRRPFASSCAVFNLESWNRSLPDYPITRLT